MLECHGTLVEQVGLGLGAAALVGLSVLAAVADPELWQALSEARELQRFWKSSAIPLAVVCFAASALFGGLLYRLLPRTGWWEAVRTCVAVLAVTSTVVLPIGLIWLAHAILDLAIVSLVT